MTTFRLSGFPRVGAKRELKICPERYWRGGVRARFSRNCQSIIKNR